MTVCTCVCVCSFASVYFHLLVFRRHCNTLQGLCVCVCVCVVLAWHGGSQWPRTHHAAACSRRMGCISVRQDSHGSKHIHHLGMMCSHYTVNMPSNPVLLSRALSHKHCPPPLYVWWMAFICLLSVVWCDRAGCHRNDSLHRFIRVAGKNSKPYITVKLQPVRKNWFQ